MNPAETGFYLTGTRYYDPEVGRFINCDSYVSTGQGILGTNMFAYCANNPIVNYDPSGQMHIKCAGLGGGMPAYAGSGGGGGGVTVPVNLPNITLQDAAVLVLTTVIVGLGTEALREEQFIYRATTKSIAKSEAQAIAVANTDDKKQAYFPANPYNFHPKGLVMKVCVDIGSGKNGGIIKWFLPGTRAAIFEWNEDFKYGPHYHTMMIEWEGKHMGLHYLPNTPVPEPWNSMFFNN